jgi:outer membrane protein OmpA-like peptidoglycan-associated protein
VSIQNSPKTSLRTAGSTLLLALTLVSSGCALSNKAKGAIIGTTAGATAGAVVGNQTGSTARGAIIGAVVGGAAGTIIGARMDRQAEELALAVPGATITRVGEGMVVTFDSGLLYDTDSDRLRPEAAANLRNLAVSLKKYTDTDLLIVGHTDATGTNEYNQALSTRRATAASSFLTTEGIPSTRLRTTGMGETDAIATNDTEAGRQTNRRIEVAIFANAAARANGGE